MTWQDGLLAVGTTFFVIGAAMAILRRQAPPLSTCLFTIFASLAFATAQLSLNLYVAAAVNTVAAIEWMVLAAIATRRRVAV